jgi:hypothetical protein
MGFLMKTKCLAVILSLTALSVLPSFANTQSAFVASGTGFSELPPSCDDQSVNIAEMSADQAAADQCRGAVIRISDYSLKCKPLAHGYAARAQASAAYECEFQNQ